MTDIGVDIGGTKISAGIVKDGKLTKVITKKTSKSSKNKTINQIIEIIEELFNSDIKNIGIGVPGIVDKKGVVYEVINIPLWTKVQLKKILEKKFKVPVLISNDAKCFALGERYFGKGKGHNNLVGLVIGTGLGAGIIIGGKLYPGNNGAAGEFGQIIYLDKNIEYYCSGKFFKKVYNIDGESLYKKALKKDKSAIKIFNVYGKHLGKALSVIVNSVDPDIIILGGAVSKSYKFFKNSMLKSLRELIYKKTFKNLKIAVSGTNNIAILGAASLCG